MKDSMKKTYSELEKWLKSYFENGNAPFSFTLKDVKGLNGAKASKTYAFPTVAKRMTSKLSYGKDAFGNKTLCAEYTDEKSHLRFVTDVTFYNDVPAFDLVTTISNISETECSPVIDGFASFNASYPLSCDGKYNLENANGSLAKASDFETKNYELTEKLEFTEPYGRSSDGAWPYFAVDGKKGGFLLAIGWSGNWFAEFENIDCKSVNVKINMFNFKTFLTPGEKLRSERIVFVANEGDNEYGHNLFRKTVISHYTPYCRKGKPFKSPICINFWGGRNTAFITKVAKKYADAGIKADLVWMDAAWYGNYPFLGEDVSVGWGETTGGPWYEQLGVWEDNKNLYPHGIKEVADYIHANTPYRLLLWWMLEDGRINYFKNTYNVGNGDRKTVECDVNARQTFGRESYYNEIINVPGGRTVLKLSDEKVFKKVLNYYRNKFSNDNIDCMRIDYWSRPAAAWITNDKEEATELAGEKFAEYRNGISENKYITNLYRFFDTMYEEYPDWMLDNCSSGGRRLDIEMALRGIPLWRTDYNDGSKPDYCEANQIQTEYLARWLPLNGIGVSRPTDSSYYPRSFFCAGPCIQSGKFDDKKLAEIKKVVDEYVMMRPFWYGDYYQLLPVVNDHTSWQAYEMYREDLSEGVLVSVIRPETTESERKDRLQKTFKLKGLDKNKNYLVHDIDDNECKNDKTVKGSVLMSRGVKCTGKQRSIQVHTFKEVK